MIMETLTNKMETVASNAGSALGAAEKVTATAMAQAIADLFPFLGLSVKKLVFNAVKSKFELGYGTAKGCSDGAARSAFNRFIAAYTEAHAGFTRPKVEPSAAAVKNHQAKMKTDAVYKAAHVAKEKKIAANKTLDKQAREKNNIVVNMVKRLRDVALEHKAKPKAAQFALATVCKVDEAIVLALTEITAVKEAGE